MSLLVSLNGVSLSIPLNVDLPVLLNVSVEISDLTGPLKTSGSIVTPGCNGPIKVGVVLDLPPPPPLLVVVGGAELGAGEGDGAACTRVDCRAQRGGSIAKEPGKLLRAIRGISARSLWLHKPACYRVPNTRLE